MQQTPPFAVQVEFTEGCNLACSFCGINGIREGAGGPFNFMVERTASRIAEEIARVKWNPRIEFAMHGEPSMNPKFVELIAIFRNHLPRQQLMMTSNGGGFLRDISQIDAAFEAGLNLLVLDDYKSVRIVPKVLERYRGARPKYNYPFELAAAPHRRWRPGTQAIIVVADLLTSDQNREKGTHTKIDNHAGCAEPPLPEPLAKRCAKPFRELSVRWDGNIALCCDDWRGVYLCGNLLKTPIDALWNNEAFQAARKKLYHKDRTFGACKGCDKISYRTHWLPDPRGKQSLPPATPKDEEEIKRAVTHRKIVTVVLRPWEAK